MEKEVKVNSETNETGKSNLNFYLIIYNKIKQNGNIADIVRETGVKKQNLNFYVNKLKDLKIIARVDHKNVYLGWKVLKNISNTCLMEQVKVKKQTGKSKSSIGTSQREASDLHALQLNIPILSGKIQDSDWETKEKLKNWIPKYTNLKELGGLKIKNNNNKSITIWASARKITNIDQVHKLVHAILLYSLSYFKVKYSVVLDTINAEVKNLDIATEDKAAEKMRGKGEKFTLKLNKKCEKILPKDNRDALAWIDGSPYNFSAESNDTDWKREYLNMPFNIKHLIYSLPALEEYNKNLKLHIKVQEENYKTQKDIQKLLKQLQEKL
jgi:hypothetical protein